MIIISGDILDINEFSEYSRPSIEWKILNELHSSGEKYRYDNHEQLRFEVKLRKEIVNASVELAKSGFSFAVFHKSRCNPKYWIRTSNGGFRLREDVRPSDAISDIFINGRLYATECATAMPIVYLKALLSAVPEAIYNNKFDKIYLMNWHNLPPLIREVGIPRRSDDVIIGDRGYFNNPDVDPKTPELQGENVIVLPDSLYYGHGIGVTTADRIIRMLNSNRRRNATRSAYFMDSVARPNFKRIYSAVI
jgi:protein-glutamine gamma-glutamyltransferase